MQKIELRKHVGDDGILRLEIPVQEGEADYDIIVLFDRRDDDEWSDEWFDLTAGSLADDPIERPSQFRFTPRDEML